MIEGREAGHDARSKILLELYAREDDGSPPPSLSDLGNMLGLTRQAVHYHVKTLDAAGLVQRKAGELGLTNCAREAIRLTIGG